MKEAPLTQVREGKYFPYMKIMLLDFYLAVEDQ